MIPITYDSWKASEPWNQDEEFEFIDSLDPDYDDLPLPPWHKPAVPVVPEFDDQVPF